MVKLKQLRLIRDWILVKDQPVEALAQDSKLIIPDSSKGKHCETGIVIKAGPGRYDRKTGRFDATLVKEGDRIIFHEQAGKMLEIEKIRYRLLSNRNVRAIIC